MLVFIAGNGDLFPLNIETNRDTCSQDWSGVNPVSLAPVNRH